MSDYLCLLRFTSLGLPGFVTLILSCFYGALCLGRTCCYTPAHLIPSAMRLNERKGPRLPQQGLWLARVKYFLPSHRMMPWEGARNHGTDATGGKVVFREMARPGLAG